MSSPTEVTALPEESTKLNVTTACAPTTTPPPGANNPDTNNTTNPTRPTATRHPKNLLTCNLLQIASRPGKHNLQGRADQDTQITAHPPILPPPPD